MEHAPTEITGMINALSKQCWAWETATGTLKALPQQATFQREQVICDTVLDHHMPPIIGGMYGIALGVVLCFVYSVAAKLVRHLTRAGAQAWFAR